MRLTDLLVEESPYLDSIRSMREGPEFDGVRVGVSLYVTAGVLSDIRAAMLVEMVRPTAKNPLPKFGLRAYW